VFDSKMKPETEKKLMRAKRKTGVGEQLDDDIYAARRHLVNVEFSDRLLARLQLHHGDDDE